MGSTAGYSLGLLTHCCCLDLLCKRMGFSPFSALFLYIKLYVKCIQPKSAPEHLYFAFVLYFLYFNLYISVY
uniref:Putative ovule protein n=1 Tax=Solanum chacoense TaxID=4108 RepID=A0A0V0GNQ6_SOLCH